MKQSSTNQPSSAPVSFPPGISNIFGFQIFNALSFQMILGSPMVLYAKSLGATATVLGLIAGMMPLLVIFQIPAARHVSAVGYKRFVLAGWSTRVGFIFGMALVPLAEGFLAPATCLALMMFLLFWFNLSRGISSCAWLPWITSLIPPPIRGRYLAREAAFVNFASFLAFVIAAAMLGRAPQAFHFAAVFMASALTGVISLSFMKRIPEGESPEQVRTSTTPVPWREIASYPPFRKLLRMNVAWSFAFGGLSTFTVVFLKVVVDMPERNILLLSSTSFLGGLCTLWLLGARLDRHGSKPVLAFSCAGWLVILLGWTLIAARVLAPKLELVLLLMFLMGLGAAMVNMASTRLAMAVVPTMGRNHFFALYSVVGSLALGVSPILWGLLIDAFLWLEVAWHGFEFNRYTVFYLLAAAVFGVTLVLARRLEEPEAGSLEDLLRDMLQQSPRRFWLRFWPRA